MKYWLLASSILFVSMTPSVGRGEQADKGWIDTHFHVVGDKGEHGGFEQAAKRVLAIMDEAGIRMAIVMSPPRPFKSFDMDELLTLQKLHPTRFAVMGGGGTLNPMIQEAAHSKVLSPELRKEFETIAGKIIADGAKGFGEITAHHVSLNPGHGYESVPADHPLLLLLADIAARHDVPIDLHFDPVPEDVSTPSELSSPKNPPQLKENVSAFERLLEHNRKAKIVWAHAGSDPVGFYTPELVRALMQKHPNLYCSIRTTHRSNNPMRHPMRGVNAAWIAVVKAFPERFVMGTDSFTLTSGYTGPNGPKVFEGKSHIQREGVNAVLTYMGGDLAEKVGRTNAVRIYNLQK